MHFAQLTEMEHEQVVLCYDKSTGTRGIIALHSTELGPALGGLRRWHYPDEASAVTDALRLSQGMTYKCAAARLPIGGGKSVLWKADKDTPPTESEARALARGIDRLNGLYCAAEDVGVDESYIGWMSQETPHVMGAANTGGDPSPHTAQGVINGLRAGLGRANLGPSLAGLRVAIQGVGSVGWRIAEIAKSEGAELIVADIDQQTVERAVQEIGATAVSVDEIVSIECDVFAPCALGGGLNSQTIPALRCAVVCGAANNQLLDQSEHGAMLADRGIVYCPDFVVNAGGVIWLAGLWRGFSEHELRRLISHIEWTTETILSCPEGANTQAAAIAYAKERIAARDASHPGALGLPASTAEVL